MAIQMEIDVVHDSNLNTLEYTQHLDSTLQNLQNLQEDNKQKLKDGG